MNSTRPHAGARQTSIAVSALSKRLTLAAMSLGFVVVQLDVTVVNVALKSIGASIGGSIAGLQWVVNAYTLCFAALILSAGALGDRIGAKRVFVAGFGLFVAASLGCALAPGLPTLIAARAMQGVGAAVLVPCSLALLNHAYPEDGERAKAVGIWAAGASVALAAGPIVGGVLIAALGWRAIFFINLPLGLAGIWLTLRYATETTRTPERRFDLPGQVAAVLALALLAAAMIEGGAFGWTSPPVLGGFGAFLGCALAFLLIELKVAAPMLPLRLFSDRTFSATTSIGLLMNVFFYGLIFALSLFFQQLRGDSALLTGLFFLPMMIAVLVANLVAARLAAWMGARRLIIAGQALLVLGCLALLGTKQQTPYAWLVPQLAVIGGGVGLVVPAMTTALLGSVDKSRSGIASGILNAMRQTGSVIGVALFGSLIAGKNHFMSGLRSALLISVGLIVIGILAGLAIAAARPAAREQR